jgi:hypothetical protein
MEETILRWLRSHGITSVVLSRVLLLSGAIFLLVAAAQTSNPWIWAGIIAFSLAEVINRRPLLGANE